MIFDLIDDSIEIRLITRNVMSVFSASKENTDRILRKIKHGTYLCCGEKEKNLVAYSRKDYNIYSNIFEYVSNKSKYNTDTFAEYLNYFNLNHLLWMRFVDLRDDERCLVEILIQILSDKPIVVLDYIEKFPYKDRLCSLIYQEGLKDRIIIIPYTDIAAAVNNSTCQCYVRDLNDIKVQSKFSNAYLNTEFNTTTEYYTGKVPMLYEGCLDYLLPSSYRYQLNELFLIFLYRLYYIWILFFNWRHHVY